MPVAFDAGSSGYASGAASLTVSHTCSGSDRALVVSVICNNSSDTVGAGTVTYNGVSMGSPAVSRLTRGSQRIRQWVLVAPDIGTHNIVLTPMSDTVAALYGASFTGVDQTTPYDSTASTDKSSSGTDSLAVTVTSGGMVVDAASFSGVLTASGGMTQVAQRSTGYGYSACGYLANATAAVWTFSGSDYFVHTAVSLKTVAAAAEISGSATLGDITAAGGMGSAGTSDVSGSATLGDIAASGSIGIAPGVITTPVLKNNTGTILASVSGIVANVYHPTTGALVLRKIGLSSNASGIVTISDVLLISGTSYAYELDLSAAGLGRRLPLGTAS